ALAAAANSALGGYAWGTSVSAALVMADGLLSTLIDTFLTPCEGSHKLAQTHRCITLQLVVLRRSVESMRRVVASDDE
ncbi:hypothetical protein, partial [Rhodococcus globerulus]|uniref:hypothetical protein n=1 Tax=Rhodococcus globerulus TaxID=33008 RepID=UPI001F3279A2